MYKKHAVKRRQDAAEYKEANREYFALAEWFRKKGIPISHLSKDDVTKLIEMKRAINQSKLAARLSP